MACGLSKSFALSSSLKIQQGIVTILGSGESDISSNSLSAPSLRRTFSADLSSKNWLTQNEVSPMKRISSSEKLRAFATSEEEGSKSGFDIWTQIQEGKRKKEEEIEAGQFDVWSSILSDKKKKTESSNDAVPPPYVHPLMKRASSLSEKSLKICTESLGSETGCEGFSSYASSETGDAEIEKEIINQEEEAKTVVEDLEVEQEPIIVPIHTPCNELPRGSFPPPIRSLSSQSGTSLHMKTCRDNGRLVLEAVSMPSHNNFSAKRQNGRLLLTFAEISNEPNQKIDIASVEEDETDSEIHWFDEEEDEKNEFAFKPNGLMYKLSENPMSAITVHRLAHKPISVPKRNSRWPETKEFDTKSDSTPIVHSLPPRPRMAQLARSTKPPSTVDDTVGAACFNTYDYYWKPINTETLGPNRKTQFQAQIFDGCKERRRSLLSVESFCIAT